MRVQNLSLYCRYRNGRVPIAIGMKVEIPPAGQAGKEGEGAEFIIILPI
jgi:hypothetical protein